MKSVTIARNYAEALFEAADAQRKTESYGARLTHVEKHPHACGEDNLLRVSLGDAADQVWPGLDILDAAASCQRLAEHPSPRLQVVTGEDRPTRQRGTAHVGNLDHVAQPDHRRAAQADPREGLGRVRAGVAVTHAGTAWSGPRRPDA